MNFMGDTIQPVTGRLFKSCNDSALSKVSGQLEVVLVLGQPTPSHSLPSLILLCTAAAASLPLGCASRLTGQLASCWLSQRKVVAWFGEPEEVRGLSVSPPLLPASQGSPTAFPSPLRFWLPPSRPLWFPGLP